MSYKVKDTFEKSTVEMRKVYAETLMEMAEKDERICILDADLVGSSGTKPFFKAFPERAIDCGIQEANMIGVAAGMSAVGMIPFAHSFAVPSATLTLPSPFRSSASSYSFTYYSATANAAATISRLPHSEKARAISPD